jgi:hypothetical protein
MPNRIGATARVTVVLEIDASASWGPGCTVEQIQRQAGQETTFCLLNLLNASSMRGRVRLVTPPTVSAVITREVQK